MNVGDRVKKDLVLKVENATGTIEKINKDYVVVVWDNINGHWHYTHEQAKALELIGGAS